MTRGLYVVALVVLGMMIACTSMAANSQSCSMVALTNISPQHLMMTLGLCSDDDLVSGKDISWNLTDKPAAADKQSEVKKPEVSPMMPKGISSVISAASKKSVLVIGDTPSIEQFKTIAQMLDVPQKQVQVKAEIYEITPGSVQMISASEKADDKNSNTSSLKVVSCNPDLLKGLKEQLQKDGAKLLASPIISTVNNMPALLTISASAPSTTSASDAGSAKDTEPSCEVRVLPKVLGDGTIDLIFKAAIPGTAKPASENGQKPESQLHTEFRVQSGESMLLYQTTNDSGNWLLFIVTSSVVKDAQEQSASTPVVGK